MGDLSLCSELTLLLISEVWIQRDAKGEAMWLPCDTIAKINVLNMGQSLGFLGHFIFRN